VRLPVLEAPPLRLLDGALRLLHAVLHYLAVGRVRVGGGLLRARGGARERRGERGEQKARMRVCAAACGVRRVHGTALYGRLRAFSVGGLSHGARAGGGVPVSPAIIRRERRAAIRGAAIRRGRVVPALASLALRGRGSVLPGLPAAGQRVDVGVAHLLQIVGGERRAVAAAAVEDEFRAVIRNRRLDVALDDAAPHVRG